MSDEPATVEAPTPPPESVRWRDDPDDTLSVEIWIKATYPNARVVRKDSFVGPVLEVNLGLYGFKVQKGMLVVKEPNGLFSAMSVAKYQRLYHTS